MAALAATFPRSIIDTTLVDTRAVSLTAFGMTAQEEKG